MTDVVVVTGAASGNGLATAKICHQADMRVIGIDRTPSEWVQVVGDVLSLSTIDAAFQLAAEEPEKACHLVNNAGLTLPGVSSMPYREDHWNQTIETNLTGPYRWIERYAQQIRSKHNKPGNIVNICSLAAHLGLPSNPAYAASKGGLLALTRAYALDLAHLGIRVNSVSPGYVRTGMTATSWNDPTTRSARSERSILGRWAESDEIAHAIVFLLSGDASFITGTDLAVDGGWIARGL